MGETSRFKCDFSLFYLGARRAIIIFLDAPPDYQTTLSQTVRIFAFNLKEFPGRPAQDFVMTSDTDLWPLRKEHFLPRPNSDIVLLHSECCTPFSINNRSYPMYPMSNIGATVSTWRQIMNDNHKIAFNSDSILNYLGDVFGEQVRRPLVVGEEGWYMDQRMISIRLLEWMTKHGNSSVYRVSDHGFSRFDRIAWNVGDLLPESFARQFDAHLPEKMFLSSQWKRNIQPLLLLMYGKHSWEARWCTMLYKTAENSFERWAFTVYAPEVKEPLIDDHTHCSLTEQE
ncbi:hypothetical protein DAPPUDRAFT_119127 [Daphnia pulex]|uniref:Uncharacterized protein n=1 Tax=Daphnia pulex TaxID=6669 RepID=E9HXJ4_DAPPU|nr:hypothetical protein DAPPUDRAFT_119127 [Daphnia pulex]|eukprot:EFX63539.1 hypothetical protein DAPPUDRAFT_119127 [Daphnia pulex]